MYVHIDIYIYMYNMRATTDSAVCVPFPRRFHLLVNVREFKKGGLVNGGLAIRYVFNWHIKNGT